MRRQNKIILTAISIMVLLMGVAYAAISNVPLTINGEATATWDDNNFTPHFTRVIAEEVVKGPPAEKQAQVTASVVDTDNTKAIVNIEGLSTKGDNAYAIIQIINQSAEIKANSINVTYTGTDTTMFDIDAKMCDESGNPITDYSVESNAYTYVKVSAELLYTAIENTSTTITVTVTAEPKNPA